YITPGAQRVPQPRRHHLSGNIERRGRGVGVRAEPENPLLFATRTSRAKRPTPRPTRFSASICRRCCAPSWACFTYTPLLPKPFWSVLRIPFYREPPLRASDGRDDPRRGSLSPGHRSTTNSHVSLRKQMPAQIVGSAGTAVASGRAQP